MFIQKKPRVYLKTYIYSPHEIKFVKLNLKESFHYIDKIIVCEYNRTHVGRKREYIFDQYLDSFSQKEQDKILYLPCDISDQVVQGENSDEVHKIERIMRGYFTSQIDLNDRDIIISVDADEIIFGPCYEDILNHIGFFNRAVKLQLHQFIYKINYHWKNQKFIAPTVCRVDYYKGQYPAQWRYDGKLLPKNVGAHFSWCMSVDQMLKKLESYSHHYDFRHLAKREILEKAIQDRTYPFDPNRDFEIEVLDMSAEKGYFPESIYTMLDEFTGLIA